MENPHRVPGLSIREAEDFHAGGTAAWPPEPASSGATLSQPDGFAGECPMCGPDCPGGAHRHALAEDGITSRAQYEKLKREKLGDDPVGIDMPGVGHVLPDGAPATVPGRPYLIGDVPEPLRGKLDDDSAFQRLLCQLPFAARELADAQVYYSSALRAVVCHECLAQQDRDRGEIHHATGCRTARVLALLTDLEAVSGRPQACAAPKGGAA